MTSVNNTSVIEMNNALYAVRVKIELNGIIKPVEFCFFYLTIGIILNIVCIFMI